MFRIFLISIFLPTFIFAQLSGTMTVPGNFSSLAAGIAALNSQGISGPLTLQIASNYTEVVSAGGYSLYTSGTAQWPIEIRGSVTGQKPLFIAPSGGTRTPGSVVQDGLLRLIGCDFIKLVGLEFRDLNTTAPQTMEFGIGFFKSSAGDGCHDNLISHCSITLNYLNNASGNLPACDGSRGVDLVNATSSAHTTSLNLTSLAGTHHHNRFYANLISHCNYGFSLMGFEDQNPFLIRDAGNEIGGPLAASGNTIVNFGGGGSNPSAAVRAQHQQSLTISNNLLISNSGAGANHTGSLRGIFLNHATAVSGSVLANTITLHGGSSTGQLVAIENQSGSGGATNCIEIRDNVVSGCSNVNATSGNFYGIVNSASTASLLINGNSFLGNRTNASSGSTFLIYNTGAVDSLEEFNGNFFSFEFDGSLPYSGFMAMINTVAAGSSARIRINNNHFGNIVHRRQTGSGLLHFISLGADAKNMEINGNRWQNIHLNHSAVQYCISNSASTTGSLSVNTNSVTQYNRMVAGNFYFYYGNTTSTVTALHTFSANLLTQYSTAGAAPGNFIGIQDTEGNVSPYPLKIISSNTISNITLSGSGAITALQLSDINGNGNSEVNNNVICNLKGMSQVTGIVLNGPFSPGNTISVSENSVSVLETQSSTASISGFFLSSSGSGLTVYKNIIRTFQSAAISGSVNGIVLNSSGNYTLHTNVVADLNASAAAGPNRVNGILINTGSSVRLLYNTIRLSASSSSGLFGSNAVFSSSTPSLELRNNIFINQSVASGSAQTAAFRRSSTSTGTYLQSSNCNIFYAGIPSSSNVLFAAVSTNYQSLAAFQSALFPRESLSYSQIPVFSSVLPSSPFFLHLSPSQSSPAESGALNVTGIAEDLDDEIRQGNNSYPGTGLAPDIGADEVESYTLPCSTAVSPVITGPSVSCQGELTQFFCTNLSGGTGISWQWKLSSLTAGPFLPLPAATSSEYSMLASAAGVYYLQLEQACSTNSSVASSAVFSLLVNASPTTAVTGSSLVCSGTSLSLSAISNAVDYYWTGPAAFTATTSAVLIVNAEAFAGGVYTLQSSANNCPAAAQIISVSVAEITSMLSAKPPVVCVGTTCSLSANGNASLHLWNGVPGSSVVTVNPTQTTVYTLQSVGFGTCSLTQTVIVRVVTPTISPINATLCLPTSTGTAGVQTFSAGYVNWYTNPQSQSVTATGHTLAVSAAAGTLYAKSFLMDEQKFLTSTSGTIAVSSLAFDLVPNVNLLIRSFDLPLTSTAACAVSLYQRNGSYQGFTNSQTGWNLIATGIVAANGSGTLSSTNFSISQFCAANQVTAFYLSVTGNSVFVSSGTVSPPGNADFTLNPGPGGLLFSPGNASLNFQGQLSYAKELCSSPLATIQVFSSAAPGLSVSPASLTICPGALGTITAAGAATYSWSNGSTNTMISVGTIQNQSLTVTGFNLFGCSSTASIQLHLRNTTPPSISAGASLVCPQQTVQLNASGANSYTWAHGPNSQSVSVVIPGQTIFKVFATDANGCLVQNTVAIATYSVPALKIQVTPSVACAGETLLLRADGAISYTWLPGAQQTSSISMNPFSTTLINVIGQSVNTCTNISFILIEPQVCAGFSRMNRENKVLIFPVPAKQVLHVQCPPAFQNIKIKDLSGRIVYEEISTSGDYDLLLHKLPPGLYLLCLSGLEGDFQRLIPVE